MLFLTVIIIPPMHADKMTIGEANVVIQQPYQLAAIAWDNGYEVLLLGTALKGLSKTRAIEILPLPSVPTVELADESSLKAIMNIVRRKTHAGFLGIGKGILDGSTSENISTIMVFEKTLGIHHIACLKVDESTFADAIISYALSNGLNITLDWKEMEILRDYIKRGYKYFLVDIVQISDEAENVQPLIIKFKSDHIWYPIKTSDNFEGKIELGILLITRNIPIIDHEIKKRFDIIKEMMLTRFEVASIDNRLLEPFLYGLFFYAVYLYVNKNSSMLDLDLVIQDFDITITIMNLLTLVIIFLFLILSIIPIKMKNKKEISYMHKNTLSLCASAIISGAILLLDIPALFVIFSAIILEYSMLFCDLLAMILSLSVASIIGIFILLIITRKTKIVSKINAKIYIGADLLIETMLKLFLLSIFMETIIIIFFERVGTIFSPINYTLLTWIIIIIVFSLFFYGSLQNILRKIALREKILALMASYKS